MVESAILFGNRSSWRKKAFLPKFPWRRVCKHCGEFLGPPPAVHRPLVAFDSVMSYSEVRSYLTSKDIPKLFTSLMAGLMYNRPEDHLEYLRDCLEQARIGTVADFRWNTFVDSKRPKSRELPPLPRRRPSSEMGRVPGATPLPPINAHFTTTDEIYKDAPRPPAQDIKRYADISDSLYHLKENARPVSPAGFRSTTVLFVIGSPSEDAERSCSDMVDGTDLTARHVSVGRLMAERMMVEGFCKLESVPACALVEEIRKTISAANSDVLLVSGFPRHERDALEWESWDLPVPDVFYFEDVNFADKLNARVEMGETNEAEKERLLDANNDALSVLDYLEGKYPEMVRRGDSLERLREAVEKAHHLRGQRDDDGKSAEPVAIPEEEITSDYALSKEARLPVVCFVGVPGAGKSLQSASAIRQFNLTRISLKELVEKEMSAPTPRAEILKNSDTELLDADLAVEIIKEAMSESSGNTRGFILDGFPQSVEQGEKMEKDLGEFKAILNLRVTPRVAVTRLMEREPADASVSEEDAESLRKSENEKSTERLSAVLEHFHHKVITVSSNGSAAEVFENVSHILEGVLEIPEEPVEVAEPECVKEEVKEEIEATNTATESLPVPDPVEPDVPLTEEEEIRRQIENLIEDGSIIADDTEADNIPLDSEVASEVASIREGETPPEEKNTPIDGNEPHPQSLVDAESEELAESEEINPESVEENVSAAPTNQPDDQQAEAVGDSKEEERGGEEIENPDVGTEDTPETENRDENGDEKKDENGDENGDEVVEVNEGEEAEEEIDSMDLDVTREDQPSEEVPADPDRDSERSNPEDVREVREEEEDGSMLDQIKPVLEVYRDLKSGTE